MVDLGAKKYCMDLHEIFRYGREMQWLEKSCIYLAIAQGTLPWQPI